MSNIETLKTFRALSENRNTQLELLKDKKAILYAAVLLENEDLVILNLCLDILENFAGNEETHSILLSTFGIYESIESLSIRMRDRNKQIFQRTMKIIEKLRKSTKPAYNTRNRLKNMKVMKKQQLFILYIEGINGENLLKLEEILFKIKGIVSFLIDIEMKRLTMRICPKLEIKEVVEKIYGKTKLKCFIIVRNKKNGLEDYIDILKIDPSISYLEYPEDITSPKRKAIIAESARKFVQSGNNVLKSMLNLWNDAFYW